MPIKCNLCGRDGATILDHGSLFHDWCLDFYTISKERLLFLLTTRNEILVENAALDSLAKMEFATNNFALFNRFLDELIKSRSEEGLLRAFHVSEMQHRDTLLPS